MSDQKVEILQSLLQVAQVHADRLTMALNHLKPCIPVTHEVLDNLTDEQLGYLELLTSRFAKLQDIIGSRIIAALLDVMRENEKTYSFLDRLHKLEKLGVINSARDWVILRDTRNMVTHEYPDDQDIMVGNLEKIVGHARDLLVLWAKLFENIKIIIEKYQTGI